MIWVRLGGALMFLAVAFGAFAAHGLKARLSPEMLAIFETGVKYHVYHALALFVVGWLSDRNGGLMPEVAGWLFVGGIAVFSGSLYALSMSGVRWLGAITPLGGLAFLAGWVFVVISALKTS